MHKKAEKVGMLAVTWYIYNSKYHISLKECACAYLKSQLKGGGGHFLEGGCLIEGLIIK